MKRQIKFRALIDGKMITPCYLELFKDGSFNAGGTNVWEEAGLADELMQYIGLKDESGKEIYEGDILQDEHGDNYEVIFDNGAFCIKSNLYIITPINWGVWRNETESFNRSVELRIIGNIHENRDLLT